MYKYIYSGASVYLGFLIITAGKTFADSTTTIELKQLAKDLGQKTVLKWPIISLNQFVDFDNFLKALDTYFIEGSIIFLTECQCVLIHPYGDKTRQTYKSLTDAKQLQYLFQITIIS